MAGIAPGFVTGANARIKIGNTTFAFCTDVSYNINVQTIPIEAMGKYEVFANEPVGYSVDGSFSVIRYTARATASADGGPSGIPGTAGTQGNAPDQVETEDNHSMQEHLNPANLLTSKTFDIEIHEKVRLATPASVTEEQAAAADVKVFQIADCRLTRRGATLNKRGILVDAYAFVGILAGDFKEDEVQVGNSSSVATDLST